MLLLYVSLFLGNRSVALQYIFKDVLGITQKINSLKKSVYNISSLLGAILRYLKVHFGVRSSIFESFSTFYLIKFCTNVFCIALTVNKLRKFSLHVALCLGCYMQYFWGYFGYISWELLSLEKLKRFPWYFSRMSWYYCSGHETKCYINLSTTFDIFRWFWSILYYVPQIVGNHLIFSNEFLFSFFEIWCNSSCVYWSGTRRGEYFTICIYLFVWELIYIYLQSSSIARYWLLRYG